MAGPVAQAAGYSGHTRLFGDLIFLLSPVWMQTVAAQNEFQL
jgi:hypothetical protein